MAKTLKMRMMEIERGEALETLLPRLFDRLQTAEAVASELEISTVSLRRWLELIGAETRRVQITTVRFRPEPEDLEQPVG